MKKLVFAAAIATFAFIGCKDNKNGSPKEVLSAWFDAMAKKDMATVKELSTPESQSMISLMEMGMKDSAASKETEKYDKTKMEFGEPIIDGDNAKVPVKEKSSGETTNFPMKKVNGQWKVAFDKSSMMQMGMDKMKDEKISTGGTESVNMDSITNEMNKAMDSVGAAK